MLDLATQFVKKNYHMVNRSKIMTKLLSDSKDILSPYNLHKYNIRGFIYNSHKSPYHSIIRQFHHKPSIKQNSVGDKISPTEFCFRVTHPLWAISNGVSQSPFGFYFRIFYYNPSNINTPLIFIHITMSATAVNQRKP